MAEAEQITVARPYARAIFARALDEPAGLDNWSRMLGILAATVTQAAVKRALESPALTTTGESKLVADILGEDLTEQARNLLVVLAEYGRMSLLPEIRDLFEHLKAQHEKTMDVSVTSAFEVDETDKARLESALTERLQKHINLSTQVDRNLLGGVVIRTEDTVIDNSVRGKLARLSQALD